MVPSTDCFVEIAVTPVTNAAFASQWDCMRLMRTAYHQSDWLQFSRYSNQLFVASNDVDPSCKYVGPTPHQHRTTCCHWSENEFLCSKIPFPPLLRSALRQMNQRTKRAEAEQMRHRRRDKSITANHQCNNANLPLALSAVVATVPQHKACVCV
jgi:hypothetical protein